MTLPPDSVLLAPMAGVTDAVFRSLCFRYGLRFGFTEMVSARALCLAPDQAVFKNLLRIGEGEKVAVQIFGSDPDSMGEAAKRLSDRGFAAIDINMGCPVRKIVGGGDGSALLCKPLLAQKVAQSVVRNTHLPVFVKMRLGWEDPSGCVSFAKRMEDAGVSLLTVHGRTRAQMYTGKVNLEGIARVKQSVAIPVVGNGDVVDKESLMRMKNETHCDAVMIGRAALGNPFIFKTLSSGFVPSYEERLDVALEQLHLTVLQKGERTAVPEMRKQLSWALHGMPGASRVREEICRLQKEEDVAQRLRLYREELEKLPRGKGEKNENAL